MGCSKNLHKDFMALLSQDIEKIPQSENLNEFLSQYKCKKIIGEGGFGKVQKAIQLHDQRNVAIKFIPNKKITSWHFDERLKKCIPMEIALMCRCRDVQGVIKIIKYFNIKEHRGWYIVMERFDKFIDMFDYITNHGHISEKMASNFLGQLLQIVINCHELGVCHRDIKDENIVINLETMKIYLIDFGAGGILHNDVYTEFDGTRVYSPPEWIQFKRYNAISLEVWSIGILLFDMVCGNLPFDNDESIVNGVFLFRRSLSTWCQHLIQRCLEHDPIKRIPITDILNHQWFTQYSNLSSMDSMKRHNLTQFDVASSLDVKYGSNIRRLSVETSPYTSPQSSGLEDSQSENDQFHDSVNGNGSEQFITYDSIGSPKHNSNAHIIRTLTET